MPREAGKNAWLTRTKKEKRSAPERLPRHLNSIAYRTIADFLFVWNGAAARLDGVFIPAYVNGIDPLPDSDTLTFPRLLRLRRRPQRLHRCHRLTTLAASPVAKLEQIRESVHLICGCI